ncbi:hypothetical protein QNM99_06845 [Pseudomonas sp. PCH446]
MGHPSTVFKAAIRRRKTALFCREAVNAQGSHSQRLRHLHITAVGGASAGGAENALEYRDWIDRFITGIGDKPRCSFWSRMRWQTVNA